MSDFLYCPIIKGKANDIKALAYVSPVLMPEVKPLFELPPFKPTDDPEVILAKFARRLAKFAGGRLSYVDFPLLRPGAKTSSGEAALAVAYRQLNALWLRYEPVFGFDREEAMWGTVIEQANRSGGLLLRLDGDDLQFPEDTIHQIADIRARGFDLRHLDVMIDHRSLTSDEGTMASASATADFIDDLCAAISLRKILVAGSSAPKTVSEIERDSCGTIPRRELVLWAHVASERLPVQPIFADYGVIHPDFSDQTPSTHINGKIRYTHGASFHIYRGHSLRQEDKYEQYRGLSAAVSHSSHYQGSSFSYGDRYIYECATGHSGTGNPGTWVLVDQNHHITYTARQFRRLAGLAASGGSATELLLQP
ncbi:beta family protein [Aquincola tertiaricarbonis]|uniref:Beta family protein n=1 Tax=Aquincola tertiaricarbonis TaxID=391953 RepID=A0ABY4S7T7_AQUTE|nr:beta family protein [Aquincola tertiaricarbonis]URI09421.1 beta family protein [Aquincola tertiaricarbonis]